MTQEKNMICRSNNQERLIGGPRSVAYKTVTKIVKFSSSLYKKVLWYRFHRLSRTTHEQTSRNTGKVKAFITGVERPLYQYHFNGEHPSSVLKFLARFLQEANFQMTRKAQKSWYYHIFWKDLSFDSTEPWSTYRLWQGKNYLLARSSATTVAPLRLDEGHHECSTETLGYQV